MNAILRIDRRQRDLLRAEIVEHDLSGFGDAYAYATNPTSGRTRLRWLRRAADALWLMDDLGWALYDERQEFHLTLPSRRLATWLWDRIDMTEACVRDEVAGGGFEIYQRYGASDEDVAVMEAESADQVDADLDLIGVCRDVLTQIPDTVSTGSPAPGEPVRC